MASGSGKDDGKEQEWFIPAVNVGRIMKKGLPNNVKISKEAIEMIHKCTSQFIGIIASEAAEKCKKEERKTINGDDLVSAMTTLGFEEYVEPLKVYLNKYREIEIKEKIAIGMVGIGIVSEQQGNHQREGNEGDAGAQ